MMDMPRLHGDDKSGFHLVALWDRRLSDNQIKQLSADPWQIFWRDYKGRGKRQHGHSMRRRRRNFVWRIKQ